MSEQPARNHSLSPLIVAQFFGAFNDNAWKLIVVTLGLTLITMSAGGSPDIMDQQKVATLAFVIFSLPMVLFSLPAGVSKILFFIIIFFLDKPHSLHYHHF